MKQQLNIRASDLTTQQLKQLSTWWNTSQTETVTLCIDRTFQTEQAKQQQTNRYISLLDAYIARGESLGYMDESHRREYQTLTGRDFDDGPQPHD